MKYQLAYHSLAGGRATNQDRVVAVERDNAVLMVLADGLGGHAGGAMAAEILTRTAQHAFEAIRQPLITKPSAFLALTIMNAHKAIVAHGEAQNPPISPRTTCVLCLVQNGYAYWAHVGDSRLYHFRHGQVLLRTRDDTYTEQLHRNGLLSEEEMKQHPEKAKLLMAVGGSRPPSITLGDETPLATGDHLLLCTDGVWEALPDPELASFLKLSSLEEGIEEMLLSAEQRMKHKADNLTAIGLRWNDVLTTARPLQPQGGGITDHKTLIDDVRLHEAEKKLRAPPRPAQKPVQKPAQKPEAGNAKQSLEATIDELEAFLSKFEKH
jgi:serine/threonine protein phosphatase PrpC